MTFFTQRQYAPAFSAQMFGSGFFTAQPEQGSKSMGHTKNKTMEKLLANAMIGIWTLDVKSKKISLCTTAKSVFNLAENEYPHTLQVFNMVKNEYRKHLLAMFKNVCYKNNVAELEIQVNGCDIKQNRWLKVTADVHLEHADCPSHVLMGTIVDITAQKLEQLRKDDCMAMLSHELRSPLTTVKLYVQMVINQAKMANDLKTAELLKKADTQATSMSRLIDNFLAMSVIENAKMEIFPEEIEMSSLIKEVATEMQLKFPEHRFEMEFSGAAAVFADKEKIMQVLVNYINNAVKYSAKNSLVVIRCVKDESGLTVSVKDEGTGISTADQLNLFDRFYRTKTSGIKGFGLGLYLVKQIMEAHQGSVWVKSALGKGSVFGFSIPSNT